MSEKEENDIKTDVALIKRDIKQIEKFFNKIDSAINSITELSKSSAVQDEILKNTLSRLEDLEQRIEAHRKEDEQRAILISNRLEEYRKSSKEDHQRLAEHSAERRQKHNQELIETVEAISEKMDLKISEQSKKINSLENWKYYLMGGIAIIAFFVSKISFDVFS